MEHGLGTGITLDDIETILETNEGEIEGGYTSSSGDSVTIMLPTQNRVHSNGLETIELQITIECENFIYNLDEVGSVFSAELTNYSTGDNWPCLEQTLEASTTLYTYGINLTNTNTESNESTLQNSTFNLCDSSGNALSFVEINGIYYLSNSSSAATSLVTDSEGIVSIYGLDVGTYSITQIVAAGGYALNTTTVEIELADDDLDGLLDYDSGDDNGIYEVTFTNVAGYSLPTTGSFGTMVFTILGIVLIATGGVLIIVKSRKK